MRRALAPSVTLLLVWTGQGLAQPVEAPTHQVPVARQALTVASQGLSRFRELVRRQGNFREMGFESPEELDQAELGDPLPISMVRLDELGRFRQGQDPESLLHPLQRVLFPVAVRGQVRSSLTVTRAPGGWEASSFGGSNLVRMLSRAREASRAATGLPPSAFFVVEVPALNVAFVGHRGPQGLVLTPTRDERSFEFRAGAPIPAGAAFLRMQPAARSRPDLPG